MKHNKFNYIKLFLASMFAGWVLTSLFNDSAIKYSNFGTENVLSYIKNSPKNKITIDRNERYVSFSEFAKAIAVLDFASVKQFQINPGQLQSVFEMAFGYFSRDNRYVADLFFYNARYDNRALDWLKLIIDAGFDVNSKIIMGDKSTSLFWIAIDNEAIDAALFLLENGASPHSWYGFESESSPSVHVTSDAESRMLWPVEYVIKLKNVSILNRKKIATALINKGALVGNSKFTQSILESLNISAQANKSVCDFECKSSADACAVINQYKIYAYDIALLKNVVSVYLSDFFYPDTIISDTDGSIYLRGVRSVTDNAHLRAMVLKISQDKSQVLYYVGECAYGNGLTTNCWREKTVYLNVLSLKNNIPCYIAH